MCVTQKAGCFEYVIRLYPNDTQTHHRRPPLDAPNGATPAERKPRPTQDTQKGMTPAGRKHHPHTGHPKRGDTGGGGIYNFRINKITAAAYVIV